ncbi:hypothetical protein SESBI_07925 [Sesbania bispinosa]|nr:hypothetical protein SESBI_07925 [Sesbania bispinosa]
MTNKICFDNLNSSHSILTPIILTNAAHINQVLGVTVSHQQDVTRWVKWIKPLGGEVALNVDGSSLGNLGLASFGGIFRDDTGEWLHAYYGNIGIG